MRKFGRREFIGTGVAALAAASLARGRTAQTGAATIEILPDETIGTISPNIYGHFVEHLGGVVYDGIWVGEGSRIPNAGGIRLALVQSLKGLGAPVIRYPGGCFADSYDWRDGVGDRARRPRRTNFWYGAANPNTPRDSTTLFEPNTFGTNEFMRFCQLTGAKPYLAANLRGLGAQAFNEWVEYCNSPAGSTTLALQRAAGPMGSVAPFNVEYWGIGNESWGCGGNLTPEEYSQEFRRFTAAVTTYGVPTKFVGAGASSDDLNWTRGFFANMRAKGEGMFGKIQGWGVHHYAWNTSGGRTTDWNDGKDDAVNFNPEQYYELLHEADKIDAAINAHWAAMGEFDTQHRVKILVDEWGSWHRPGTELKPDHLLGQQITMRDALVSSLSLDTFNRHADKVAMANIAQLVNCLHSLFLADGDRFITTPTYHVFDLFKPHMNAQAIRAVFNAPNVGYQRDGKPAEMWGLNGSASIAGKQITLTVTNTNLKEPAEATISLRGLRVRSATARIISNSDVHAHNTFAQPDNVRPHDEDVTSRPDRIGFRFAPASVTRLQFNIA